MDRVTRQKLIDAYKDGYRVVAEALAGATDDELDTAPGEGKWTARQIVHHLADSEMTSAIRLRLLIASPSPAINGYDQEEFARKLYYTDRPIEASLDAFNAARRSTAEILDRLSATASTSGWNSTRRTRTHTRTRSLRLATRPGRPESPRRPVACAQ